MKHRRAAKVDANQKRIVEELRALVGITVAVGHDDILVGYEGRTFWFEIKNPEAVSKKTGKVKKSSIKDSQKKIKKEWEGHYEIVTSIDEIFDSIGYKFFWDYEGEKEF